MIQFLIGVGCLMLGMVMLCVWAMLSISKKPTPEVRR